jgi:type VI protein secretion system component Hcp
MLLQRLAKRLSYANVVSTACLFVVLGGSAYATATITGKTVRDGSLTSADIKDHSLRPRDFKRGALRAGPVGPKGDPGAPAPSAPPAAVVRQPAGRLSLAGVTGSGPGGSIVVRSIAWSNTAGGYDVTTGSGSLKVAWGDLVIAKAPDRSSAALWKLAADGQHLATGKLQLLAPGAGAPYATYAFKDLRVTGFTTQGSGDQRQDEVRLGFETAFMPNPVFSFDPAAPLAPLSAPRVGRMTVSGIAGETDLVLDAWKLANPGDSSLGGGAGAGPADFGEFVVSQGVGATSPALLQRFVTGKHVDTVTIKLLQPGSTSVYSTYVLTDAIIGSYSVIGDGRPIERIGFDAARIESTIPVPGGQPLRTCWNRKSNSAC